MPAIPAIIGVIGTIAAAKIASNSNKHAVDVTAKGTQDALDYEKQAAADKKAERDASRAAYLKDYNAYIDRYYGGGNKSAPPAPAGPSAPVAKPLTTGGTYAPGYGPTPTPGGATTQGGPGMIRPLNGPVPIGNPDQLLQAPRGGSVADLYGAQSANVDQPLASIQPWSFKGNTGEPPPPTGPGLPGGVPPVVPQQGTIGDWNDWSRYLPGH